MLALWNAGRRSRGRSGVPTRRGDRADARRRLANGVYRAAIVIDLAPDTITYWRNPGEAGVPPAFDWTVRPMAKVEVAMPARTHFGGRRRRIRISRRASPRRDRHAAGCRQTRPARHEDGLRGLREDHSDAEAKVDLTPSAAPGADPATVEAAAKLLPRKTTPGEAAKRRPSPVGEVCLAGRAKIAGASDLFPGSARRLFLRDRPRRPGLPADNGRKPERSRAGPRAGAPDDAGRPASVEFEVRLDATASKPCLSLRRSRPEFTWSKTYDQGWGPPAAGHFHSRHDGRRPGCEDDR